MAKGFTDEGGAIHKDPQWSIERIQSDKQSGWQAYTLRAVMEYRFGERDREKEKVFEKP